MSPADEAVSVAAAAILCPGEEPGDTNRKQKTVSGLGHWLRNSHPVWMSTHLCNLEMSVFWHDKMLSQFLDLTLSLLQNLPSWFNTYLAPRASAVFTSTLTVIPGLWISIAIYPKTSQQTFQKSHGIKCNIGVVHEVSRNHPNPKKASKQARCGGTGR